MISIDNNYIKNTPEYESVGDNVFPVDFLTEEEKLELGIVKKSCCGSSGGCCKDKSSKNSCCSSKKSCCGK